MKKTKPVGNRTENRGHWTKGKRRNESGSDWSAVRKRLARLLKSPERRRKDWQDGDLRRSRHGLAEYLGASDRQVRRWLSDDDAPKLEAVALMATFCDAFGR